MAAPMHREPATELHSRLVWSRAGRLMLYILLIALILLLLPAGVHT